MKKLLDFAALFGKAALVVLGLVFIGTLVAPGIGTIIGLVIGLVLASGAVQEKLNPAKYEMHHGTCPHCGAPVKWRLAYVRSNGFNCPTCKQRNVLVAGIPRTPAEAKSLGANNSR